MTKTKLLIMLICWQVLIAFWVRMGTFVKSNVHNVENTWLAISERSYTDADWKFFPMYPHLISTVSRLIEDRVKSGLILSLGGFSVAMWYFIKLLRLDESEGVVITTLITFLLFPTSFFLGAVYSEGLFFMWIVLSFYFARKKDWPLAGLFGMFASYTNFFGIFLFPAIFIEAWKNKKQKRDLFWVLLIPLGFWFYVSYVGLTSGDWLNFYEFKFDQIVMWYQVIWRYLKIIFNSDLNTFYLTKLLELMVGIVFMVTTIAAFWKTRLSYALFGFLIYFMTTLPGTFVSLPRFVLVSFGSFLLLGRWLHARPLLKWLIWGFEFILLAVFTILFSRGYFVG